MIKRFSELEFPFNLKLYLDLKEDYRKAFDGDLIDIMYSRREALQGIENHFPWVKDKILEYEYDQQQKQKLEAWNGNRN